MVNIDALDERLEQLGLTRSGLARKAGLSTGAISDLCAHRNGATPKTQQKLLDALELTRLGALFPEASASPTGEGFIGAGRGFYGEAARQKAAA